MTRRCKYGYKTPERTALDDLASEQRREKELECPAGFSKEDMASSEEDIEDLVFQKNVLPDRTGIFDLDFPTSPKVSKGRGKRSHIVKETEKKKINNRDGSDVSSVLDTSAGQCGPSISVQDNTEENGCTDLDINGNIRPSGVSTSQSVILNACTSEESDRDSTDIDTRLVTETTKSKYFMFNIYNLL